MVSAFCFRRLVLASVVAAFSLGLAGQRVSAETITCTLDGYSAMGGMIYYTDASTYLLAGNPTSEPQGEMETWGFAWLKFDSAELPNEPVASATLTLRSIAQTYAGMYEVPDVQGAVDVGVYNAASDVAALANNSGAIAALHAAMTASATSPVAVVSVAGGNVDYAWDVTALVNQWITGAASNHGLIVATLGSPIPRFCSMENAGGGVATLSFSAVPEPSSLLLAAVGLIAVGASRFFRRRKLACRSVSPVLALAMAVMSGAAAMADPGLLLVAHGAPNSGWNKPVLEFGRQVAEAVKKEGRFKAVRTAMLEFAQPDVPTAIAELEAEGCDRIVAVPLFLAPTGHTHFDVPAVLGIYRSAKTAATLAAEGAKAAVPRVPIVLTETLADGDVLSQYAADEVRKLSKSPREEAVVLLVHGDPDHALLVERIMRRVTTRCCGDAGISYGDWASVGVGQEYPSKGAAAIQTALERKKRVLVVGLYLSTTAEKIHQRGMKAVSRPAHDAAHGAGHGMEHGGSAAASFAEPSVTMSNRPIIDHPALLDWVLKTAGDALSEGSTP